MFMNLACRASEMRFLGIQALNKFIIISNNIIINIIVIDNVIPTKR